MHKVALGIGDLDSQHVFLDSLHKVVLSIGDLQGLAINVSLQADNYNARGELDKAVKQYLIFIRLVNSFEKRDTIDYWNIMSAYNNIALIISDLEEHHDALKYYDSAAMTAKRLLSISEIKDDIDFLEDYLRTNEYNVFQSMRNVEELSQLRKRALELIGKYESTDCESKLGFMNLLGLVEKKHGNLEASRKLFESILSDSCSLPYLDKQKMALHNLANVYLEARDYETALEYFDMAIAAAIKLEGDSTEELFVSYLDKGEVLFKLERFQETLKIWETALDLGLDISNRPEYFLIYDFLKETHEILGNHAVAESYGKLLTMFESNFNESQEAIRARDQLAAIRSIIQSQETKNLKKNLLKNYVVYSAIGLMILSVLVFHHFRRVKKKKKRVLFGKIGDILLENSETEKNDL